MSDIYVNLDLAGTGGSGTELDPYHAENFITMLETGVGGGDVFHISGAYDNAAKDLYFSSSFKLQGNPTWRMNVNRFYSGSSSCKRMILYTATGVRFSDNFALSCCFIKCPTIDFLSDESTAYTKGCTFIGTTTFEKGTILDATDSIFDSSFSGGLGDFNTNNCVFTGTEVSGTHTGPQWSWIPPSWPVWNAALTAFYKAVLNYGTILSSGTPPYTDYNFDLSNHSRDSIGAYASESEPTTTTTTVAPTPPEPVFFNYLEPARTYKFLEGNLFLEVETGRIVIVKGGIIISA